MDPLLSSYNALRAKRTPWEGWWDTLRHYVLPTRQQNESDTPGEAGARHSLRDTTAVEACQKLASGHMSYMTPSNELWFKWDSPRPDAGDEVQSWYNRCSEIANRELALSNFYTELHECFLDRVGLGTGCLYSGVSRGGHLLFRHIPCGQFVCAEDDEGRMDTFMREFVFTPHQAASQFGEKALGPKARALLSKGSSPHTGSLRFLHIVRPRAKRDRRRDTAEHMPYESIYYSMDDSQVVEESGYREMPYMVTRFLKWGEGPYGLAPAQLVYPDIRQAQFLNRILDMLGEVAAFPRILELANQVGEVDLRAGGRTLINAESASLGYPREWATQGRYDVGMDRLRQKQDAINRAFFVPMLELWNERKMQMTASEVYARENERVMLFSPSFTLFACDFQPLMERVFAQLFRMGKFPQPPVSAMQPDHRGELTIEEPHVVYQGRIATIMRRLQAEGIERTLARLQGLSALAPELADHVDLETTFRLAARLDGVPEQVLRPQSTVRRMRRKRESDAARAAEQQQQQAAQLAALEPDNQAALA
ncbi:MAG: head-tail connector protein [Akkermansiaceae bacterium]|nr:head-tail connector protein [Akkermansiaceae bacterium]